MELKPVITHRLVKSEDLNHHKTLFAGRCAEWFVESSFIAVACCLTPENVVCLKIHGMEFLHPVHAGDILTFESKLVANGKSTLTVFTRIYKDKTPEITFSDGFVTFVYVDENTKPQPHGIVISPQTAEETCLYEQAKQLILTSKQSK
ncbi:MAG: acyl-CoA thioesterase [Bacteroidales bacterium]|jgi:acyl-CoA hydrolase|nr:acyl-CoA thioesterase [Bacteroidales bacterium]